MCSYNSPTFLFPPYELMQLASCVREWNGIDVVFLDAVAEEKNEDEVISFIADSKPGMIVSLIGIESIESDLAVIDRLKAVYSDKGFVIFGYYPTIFAREIFNKSKVDVILRNEPEKSFSAFLTAYKDGATCELIPGIAFRDEKGDIVVNAEDRIDNLDSLPFTVRCFQAGRWGLYRLPGDVLFCAVTVLPHTAGR